MTSTVYRERIKRAKERRDNGARRVTRSWTDAKGLTWEGRIREHQDGVLTVTVTGPTQLAPLDRFSARLNLDIKKYVRVHPLAHEPVPWTQPRHTKPVPGVEWVPAIGVIHTQLFRAGHEIARQIVSDEA